MTEKKLEKNYSIIENFISALNIEFEESKKNNVEKQITLENGERGEQLGSKFLYTFFLDQDLRILCFRLDKWMQVFVHEAEQNPVGITPVFAV